MKKNDLRFRAQLFRDRLRRRWRRHQIERVFNEILSTIDPVAFEEQLGPLRTPPGEDRPGKFLDTEVWLREAVWRALYLGLDLAPTPVNVLDIGSGTGWFLLAARHFGHRGLGLDVPGEPVFDRTMDLLAMDRMEHRIEPFTLLPRLPWRPNLVTAMMTCFNLDGAARPWGPDPWAFLLDDLRDRVDDGSRFAVKLNPSGADRELYTPELGRSLSAARGWRTSFDVDWVILTAT